MRVMSLIFLLCCLQAVAQEKVRLWNGTEVRAKGVTLTAYRPSSPDEKGTAVIICPGGSYCWLGMKAEGREVAKWLQSCGITAFVLKYRVQGIMPYITHSRQLFRGHQYPDMRNDLERAIQYVREHAAEYGIAPDRVGVMGFSAGGHLSLSPILSRGEETRPAFIAAIYPVVSMSEPCAHKRSRRALLGERGKFDQRMRDSLSIEKHIPGDCPPVFLASCKDDRVVKCRNSELLDSALTAQSVPHRYVQYRTGGHGFGALQTKRTAECRAWKEEFLKWLYERL